ncbi:uncharacterized protein K441DRAFT_659671 [Cenococcum geophilum 1.58]|uniref:uncharacterized protein n=1 Tax=Cenococcum geophilum 1.58 TaxID=794803 RepID=UPI00358E5540|nr:hypothetical protein K441DRAFT_659671 [Cenococcum geophilum 1.58]
MLKLFVPKSLVEQRCDHFRQSTDRVDQRLDLESSARYLGTNSAPARCKDSQSG